MSTAVGGMDVVGEGADIVVVAVVILHGYLDLAGVFHISRAQIYDLIVDGSIALFLVDIVDKLADTALIIEYLVLDMLGVALILELDIYAGVEESLLPEPACKGVVIVYVGIPEYLGVGFEADFCTALL